jgi:adenylate kinase
VVRHRLDVYAEQTAPLIDVYSARGVVAAIDGIGDIVEVTGRIMDALKARGITP